MAEVHIWKDTAQRAQFFDEFSTLLSRYPNLMNHMARSYEDDPTSSRWEGGEGYPDFNPEVPMFMNGVVLIVSCANMDNWEDIHILDPYHQPQAQTVGLVEMARDLL